MFFVSMGLLTLLLLLQLGVLARLESIARAIRALEARFDTPEEPEALLPAPTLDDAP